jgi:hypothetical protein
LRIAVWRVVTYVLKAFKRVPGKARSAEKAECIFNT